MTKFQKGLSLIFAAAFVISVIVLLTDVFHYYPQVLNSASFAKTMLTTAILIISFTGLIIIFYDNLKGNK